MLVDVPAPPRHRQLHHRRRRHHERDDHRRLEPPRQPELRPRQDERDLDRQREHEIHDERDVQRPVVAPSALDFVGREQRLLNRHATQIPSALRSIFHYPLAMATAEHAPLTMGESSRALAEQWRRLRWSATAVALLTSPAAFIWLHEVEGWGLGTSLLATFLIVIAFRGHDRSRVQARDPVAEPVRRRQPEAARGGRRQPPPRVVLALLAPRGDLDRDHRHPDLAARRRRGSGPPRPGAPAARDAAALPDLQLRHPVRAAADDEPLADPRLRARGRRVGRAARGRARPGGGEGGSAARRRAVAVRRGVRAGRRQARARPAVPRRAGHRQDDAREGDRDRLQLAVRLHPRLRLRRDLHRHRRDRRPLRRVEGEAARPQVGRPVHRLHRRDRRGRHAAQLAQPGHGRRRDVRPGRPAGATSSSARTARSTRAATSSSRRARGASACSPSGPSRRTSAERRSRSASTGSSASCSRAGCRAAAASR